MRTLVFSLLRRLSDGEFHSGEALARALGISRASVWNALNEAADCGVEVVRVHGRGYRLATVLDWLDADRIGAAVAARGLNVRVVDECGSTNAELLRAAELGAPSGEVLACELQTAGRGRLGRTWVAGLANALTFSLLWRFEKSVAGLGGLSLAVGIAVARALRARGIDVGLKWPNDLMWQERKLGGILIEVRGDSLGPCAAVIGIGINVRMPDDVRTRIDQPAADLVEASGGVCPRTEVLAAILDHLAQVLEAFDRHGFAPLRAEWIACHAHQGQAVTLCAPDGSVVDGIALGVDEQARLLLETGSGVRPVHTGDVSLRKRS